MHMVEEILGSKRKLTISTIKLWLMGPIMLSIRISKTFGVLNKIRHYIRARTIIILNLLGPTPWLQTPLNQVLRRDKLTDFNHNHMKKKKMTGMSRQISKNMWMMTRLIMKMPSLPLNLQVKLSGQRHIKELVDPFIIRESPWDPNRQTLLFLATYRR